MEWTKEDTGLLRESVAIDEAACVEGMVIGVGERLCHRAAAHIERLEARVAELEATQTPEHVAAWKHWAKLEGAREEREAVVAWLRGMLWRSSSEHINALSKSIGDEVAAAVERGEHKKGEAK